MAASNKGLTQSLDRDYNCIASVNEIRKTNRRQKYEQAIKTITNYYKEDEWDAFVYFTKLL